MICYLRILLESDDPGHNDLAVPALYRVFYCFSERLDPLPKLIGVWKHGSFPRTHTEALVELIHESLKTLDTARNKLYTTADNTTTNNDTDGNGNKTSKKSSSNQKRTKKVKGEDMTIDQYIACSLQFDVNEYFKRLTTYHTVDIYTALLSKYNTPNTTPAIIHYIVTYFKRMCEHTFEQDMPTNLPSSHKDHNSDLYRNTNIYDRVFDHPDPSLGYLLFNIRTLQVFNTILTDKTIVHDKQYIPLISLSKAVARRFFRLADKNHMMYVEILFHYPAHSELYMQLDNVYEAAAYMTYSEAFIEGVREGVQEKEEEEKIKIALVKMSGDIGGNLGLDDMGTTDVMGGERESRSYTVRPDRHIICITQCRGYFLQ